MIGSEMFGPPGFASFGRDFEPDPAAATFLSTLFGDLVAKMVFKAADEPGSEASVGGIDRIEALAAKESGEEALGEVFGVLRGLSLATCEAVDRGPIGAAKFVESAAPDLRFRVAGVEDEAPRRVWEAEHGYSK